MATTDLSRQDNGGLGEALATLRGRMPEASVSLADRLSRINGRYIGTARDHELRDHIDELIVNAASALGGEPGKRRALFVIGDSGSGKSTAIERAIANRKEFAPYEDHSGRLIYPMVSLEAPGSLTLKVLAIDLLRAIGYPVFKQLGEGEAWHLLKEQLVFRKVLFLHIDEMQHAVTSNNHATIEHLSNTIKSLLQIPNWPLHIIMSGVPELAKFRENDLQMKNRSNIMEFTRMTSSEISMLTEIVRRIVEVDAEMIADEAILSSNFIARLLHATDGAFGTCIELTRTTVSRILRKSASAPDDRKATVGVHHFEQAYATFSACPADENIFTAKNWTTINPANALKRMQDAFAHKRTARPKSKAEK